MNFFPDVITKVTFHPDKPERLAFAKVSFQPEIHVLSVEMNT